MSRLYINDLEKIVDGKVERFSFKGPVKYNSLISLKTVNDSITYLRRIRNSIINTFKTDIKNEFDREKGCRIDRDKNIVLSPEVLFFGDYLSTKVPTILGDDNCLLNEDGIVSANIITSDLEKNVNLILPYIKKLYKVHKNTKILDNDFYKDLEVFNNDREKVLNINGHGVFLPFNDYPDLDEVELQNLLAYYYDNLDNILRNILVPNANVLDKYKEPITKEKVLELYKGK